MGDLAASRGFSGKIAVVTGGAGGIGLACCELLAERGARVVVADLDLERAQQAAARFGGDAVAVDVSDAEAVRAVVASVETRIGAVDHLVTSAGLIQGAVARPDQTDWSLWDKIFAVNVKGSMLCCAEFGAAMARRRRGSIVAIASLAGMRSTPLHSYGPSKSAILNIVQNLAAEWGRAGVRVNCVSPGYVLTEAFKAAIDSGHRDARRLEESSALGRMVLPQEIASTVAFLLSNEASAITGINIPVENGATVASSWGVYGGLPAADA